MKRLTANRTLAILTSYLFQTNGVCLLSVCMAMLRCCGSAVLAMRLADIARTNAAAKRTVGDFRWHKEGGYLLLSALGAGIEQKPVGVSAWLAHVIHFGFGGHGFGLCRSTRWQMWG